MAQASVMTNPPAVKACILGESGAGKSSLVLLQTTGEFHGNQVRLQLANNTRRASRASCPDESE